MTDRRTTHLVALPPRPTSAGVYVDIENLKSAEHARVVVETVVRDWPENLPPIRRLYLYTPADKSELWDAWLQGRFPEETKVNVRGVQRFARTSKNSADMAIVGDAVADFTAGVVGHVAVVSNDSDFGALFVKIKELASPPGRVAPPPFLWINLPGEGGLSKEVQEFVPGELQWEIPVPPTPSAPTSASPGREGGANPPSNAKIAEWVLREAPTGPFKADDVRKIIGRRWPKHPAAQTTAVCGQFLAQQLLPLLKSASAKVRVVRQQSPRTYEKVG